MNTIKYKNIIEYKKEDFGKIPCLSYEEASDIKFRSFIIIPSDNLCSTGFKYMKFVLIDDDENPICATEPNVDILDLTNGHWTFDCLPCGYVRGWCGYESNNLSIGRYAHEEGFFAQMTN